MTIDNFERVYERAAKDAPSNLDWLAENPREFVRLISITSGNCEMCIHQGKCDFENDDCDEGIIDWLAQPHFDAPIDPGEASMMSVDAFIEKQTEHESLDTREKLEADMRKILHDAYMVAWEHGRENRRGSSFERLLVDVEFYNLLDRQASITEHTAGIAAKEASKVLRETIADLREDVAERDDVIAVLKAENEELRKALGK